MSADLSGLSRGRTHVVVAGPGLALTIPGIVVTEIVRALTRRAFVTRVEIDVTEKELTGLHRAPSLASLQSDEAQDRIVTLRAPHGARERARSLHSWIDESVDAVVVYAWPGLDNSWIDDALHAARRARVTSSVLCASLPGMRAADLVATCSYFALASRVVVGRVEDARTLRAYFGTRGPSIEVDRALTLTGRDGSDGGITAFLPRDNVAALATVLAAFDAVPEAWADDYGLRVVMRHSDGQVGDMVAASYHANRIQLVDEEMTRRDLDDVVAGSAAAGVAEPTDASPTLDTAIEHGIATVAMLSSRTPLLRRGYVGGLVADLGRPASVHVAFNHALRLAALRFPSPESWDALAQRLTRRPALATSEPVPTATARR